VEWILWRPPRAGLNETADLRIAALAVGAQLAHAASRVGTASARLVPRIPMALSTTALDPPAGAPAPSRPVAANSSSGRIHYWPGASLWIGRSDGRTQWHDHHAHQLSLALDGQMRLRTQEAGPWRDFRAAFVRSHAKHQFEVDGARVAQLFVEPESRAGRALVARHGGPGAVELPDAIAAPVRAALRDALDRDADTPAMIAAGAGALALLCGASTEVADELDPRLARALAHVQERIRHPVTLADAAAVAHLSGSRFRHLFVAETGCSFRAWLLWLRINVAIESACAGASWTEAAHEAGFADSAHLSRTHKRMFGIEPTSIRHVDPTATAGAASAAR